MIDLQYQYALVTSARSVLFDYCETIEPKQFNFKLASFGNKSIGDLLIHIAEVYHHWIGNFAGVNNSILIVKADCITVGDVRILFKDVDKLIEDFLMTFHQLMNPFTAKIPGREQQFTVTPLQLFTHVITHEFHHKGQVLTMSRQLGYTPVDTDIIRTLPEG
jgi:uncharacterized damage-inducible protein DinB